MTDLEKRNNAVATLKQLGYIASLWHVDDIIGYAVDMGYDTDYISKEEAMEILEDIERNHDATIGINWDVIRYHIENFLENRL